MARTTDRQDNLIVCPLLFCMCMTEYMIMTRSVIYHKCGMDETKWERKRGRVEAGEIRERARDKPSFSQSTQSINNSQ